MAQAMPTRGKMVRVTKGGQKVIDVQMDEEGRVKMGEPEPVQTEDTPLEPASPDPSGDDVYPNPFSQNVNLEFQIMQSGPVRSEERRVGKEGRARGPGQARGTKRERPRRQEGCRHTTHSR